MEGFKRCITEWSGQEIYYSEDYRFLVKTRTTGPATAFGNFFDGLAFLVMIKDAENWLCEKGFEKNFVKPRLLFLDDKNSGNTGLLFCDVFVEQSTQNIDIEEINKSDTLFWAGDFGYTLEFALRRKDSSDSFNSNAERFYRDYKHLNFWNAYY
jgi:hypothetical protein